MLAAISSDTIRHESFRLWFEEQLVVIGLEKAELAGSDPPFYAYSNVKTILQRYVWYETSLESQAILVWQRINARLLQSLSQRPAGLLLKSEEAN